MAYKICRVKNISEEVKTFCGKEFQPEEVYQIPDIDRITWASNDDVLIGISDAVLKIGDGVIWFDSVSDQIDWLKNY